ncbi:MAG: tRNA 4-thiouridine(8) synthase ThiI [Syntrophaceae bacterium]
MGTKGIALISGGLDSLLAVKLILDQGIEVMGVTFVTPFFSAKKAKTAAKTISLPLTIVDITEEHLEMLKAPKYGYGKNMNPCIDCHTLMLKIAGRIMETQGADFLFTGEVLGQRPMSQTKQSLHVVAKNSGYQEYILRPLSAQLLPETKPEIEGKVDRQRLLAIQGRGRKDQIELARIYGISGYAAPAGGCLLTDPPFSKRLRDLFNYNKEFRIRDIELLKYGRQFRINETTKVIVGRNSYENDALTKLSEEEDVIITMPQFPGPTTLIPGGGDDSTILLAASLCALYSDAPKDKEVIAHCWKGETSKSVIIKAAQREDAQRWMI